MRSRESSGIDIITENNLGHSCLKLRSDGIAIIECSDNFEYDVKHVKENHEALKKYAEAIGRKIAVVSITRKYSSATNEARAYVAKAPHSGFIKAEAFVIQGLAQKLVAQFYLKVNKPVVPARFFTSLSEAIVWAKNIP